MPIYQLGNGNDYFNSQNQPGWTDDSAVFGGNGNDTIVAVGLSYGSTSIFVDGGNGDDVIRLRYTSNSTAFGGNGNDTLTSGGLGNTLIGGNGDDTLISLGGGSGMQPGNTLTGGLGRDTFTLVNDGNLVVLNDAAGNGVVSDGDTFKGPMDVITDLGRGDHIGLRDYDGNTNGPTASDVPLARVDSVALVPELYTYNYYLPPVSDFRPAIGSAEYAVFHGTFAGGNTFTVGADGPDLLAVYDTRTGPFELVGKGSLVLQGVTDEMLLDQALSPATAQGTGSWGGYSQADGAAATYENGSQTSAVAGGASMPAVLDQPTGSVGLIPA